MAVGGAVVVVVVEEEGLFKGGAGRGGRGGFNLLSYARKRGRALFFSAPSAPFLPRDNGHTPYLLHIWEIIIYMRNYYLHRHPLVAKVVREVQQRQHGLVGEHKERRRVHS